MKLFFMVRLIKKYHKEKNYYKRNLDILQQKNLNYEEMIEICETKCENYERIIKILESYSKELENFIETRII